MAKAKATSGPNGPTSTLTLGLDAVAINQDHELRDSILMLARSNCTPDLCEWIERTIKDHDRSSILSTLEGRKRPLSTGHIAFVPDKGIKTRVIAICDGFTSLALQPMHDMLIETLRSLKTSAAFKQTLVQEIILYRTHHNLFCGSSDATAFTDRFPYRPQSALLESIVGAKMIIHYDNVINRTFTVQNQLGKIGYAVGQPIGFLGSWPLATLAHHALVEYCAEKVLTLKEIRVFREKGYCVLGDDVVIFHEQVYNKYLETCHLLGIDLNSNKSTASNHACEFAKQLI